MTDHQTEAAENVVASGPRYDDVNTPVILMVGVISAIVTFLIIALVQGMCYHWEKSYLKRQEVIESPAAAQIREQKEVLESGEGILTIDQAMANVIEQYGEQK